MIKYGLISDIHMEFYLQKESFQDFFSKFKEHCLNDEKDYDVLIIAGDLHYLKDYREFFLSSLSKPYIFVHGNHDYYGRNFPNIGDDIKVTDKYFAGTLWTNFRNDPYLEYYATRAIQDFHSIRNISTEDVKFKFEYEWKMINDLKKDLVITHFPFFTKSIHPRYQGDPINGYFVNEMDNRIMYDPKICVHGHVHDPFDYQINETRVICNPLGYPNENFKDYTEYRVKLFDL